MNDFDWQFPYPSRRMPVMARNVVATSQPLAAQAGLGMLARGGNAIDAALATAIALTVVEPNMNGIGSDAFALIYYRGRLYGLNASGRSPMEWTRERFDKYQEMPDTGWDTITVPGCVSAWAELSRRYGKIPFAELFHPAIEYAERGYHVSPITARAWERGTERLGDFTEFRRVFMPEDRAPRAGELFKSPDHARTLEEIATSGGESFYSGELAARIATAAARDGGALVKEDLARHEADWVQPIRLDYRGYTLNEIPPNGQGLASLIALGILRNFDVAKIERDSADSYHLQIEAMKLALADAHRYISDPGTMDLKVSELLDEGYLEQRAKLIDMKQAAEPTFGLPRGGTVLLCAADALGNMVSFIQSNFWGFGSGIVVPGTGIALQNRGNGFSLENGHPNEVGPGKRPFHTIIPGFVTRNSQPVMAFGMMGGPIQAQGHTQLMVRMADYRQNPQAAVDAPRWRVLGGRQVALEETLDSAVVEELKRRGHDVEVREYQDFGGAQLIYRLEDGGYCAASDPRKDGQAVGF